MKVLKFLLEVTNFKCISCSKEFSISQNRVSCDCGGLLDVLHDWSLFSPKEELKRYSSFPSGVWKYKPLIYPSLPDSSIITRGEGNTGLYQTPKKLSDFIGSKNILLKHEGENPTGSFKDRGMAVGISEAKNLNVSKTICASTGNTSASLAAYSSYAEIPSTVVIPEGKISFGKLAQAIAYGADVYQADGNFDNALQRVQQIVKQKNYYLLNSINPWRIEGQKTIIFELLEQLYWKTPDWIVVPAGNLGNTSSFGKALKEAKELNLIEELPRLVSIQAEKAQPFVQYWKTNTYKPNNSPDTLATAINIGNPVNLEKAMKSLNLTNGLAISVSDQEILDAKAMIDSNGIGCEPASASTIAGIKNLIEEGIILTSEKIVAILTGHLLKDPQIVIDYHKNILNSINANYSNKIKSISELN